jgi:predicted DNA-binding transcriptional regulator YafY
MNIRLRHDAIVRTLRRNGTATVDDLACEVGASRRTVLRDITALRDQGFVIHSESGRGGGVQLDPQSVQTTTRLSVAEVFALLISVAAMRAAHSLPFSNLADAGLAKIEKALPSDKVRDLRRLLDCLHIGQLSPQQDISDLGPIDPDLLPTFETAFLQQCRLRFQYRDAQGTKTSREIEPQAMLILSPWIASANRNQLMARPSDGGMCHSRMTSAHLAIDLADHDRADLHSPCNFRHKRLTAAIIQRQT